MKRSCKKLGIELLEGTYDYENWIEAVRGLEKEPEKGARCEVCFDKRFIESANKALEIGEKTFTTTLLVSPLKSQEQLKKSGEDFELKYGVKFIAPDYRSGGGTQDQSRVTKEEQLYRQDYCGCIYGLDMQRKHQDRLMDEMMSEISNRILPASIEERIELYTKRIELEEEGKEYKIVKEKFLNYRIFSCTMKTKENSVAVYPLIYSLLPRKNVQTTFHFTANNLHYYNRDEIIFITLEDFNTACHTNYKDIKELIYNPLTIEEEVKLRERLGYGGYNLTPIFVTNEIVMTKVEITLDAKIYEDTREKLIII